MCESHRHFAPLLSRTLYRIPQAVGAVATKFLQKMYGRTNEFQYRKR